MLKKLNAAARADLERRPADWLLPPKPKEDVLPPKPKEDALPQAKGTARPPAPEPDAAPFTKEELIDRIADCALQPNFLA